MGNYPFHYIPDFTNTYGSLCGFIVSMVLRITGGEPVFSFKAAVHYPWYDEESGYQLFPFKTVAMLCGFVTLMGVSFITNFLFENERISYRWDFMGVFSTESCDLSEKKDGKKNPGYITDTAF